MPGGLHDASMAGGAAIPTDDEAVIEALFSKLDQYFKRSNHLPVQDMPCISFQDLYSLQRQFPGQFSRLSTASVTPEQEPLILNAVFTPGADVADAATSSAAIPGILTPGFFLEESAFDGGFIGLPGVHQHCCKLCCIIICNGSYSRSGDERQFS